MIAARGRDGAVAAYDPAENVHRDGILHRSTAAGRRQARHGRRRRERHRRANPGGARLCRRDRRRVLRAARRLAAGQRDRAARPQFRPLDRGRLRRRRSSSSISAPSPAGRSAPPTRHSDCVMENLIGDDVLRVAGPARRARPDAASLRQGRGAARPQDGPLHPASAAELKLERPIAPRRCPRRDWRSSHRLPRNWPRRRAA